MVIRKLHSPMDNHEDGSKIFCAPFAMMALTGKTAEQIYKVISIVRPNEKPRLHGMFMSDVTACLNHMGFSVKTCNIHKLYDGTKAPTLTKWLNNREGLMRRKTYILYTRSHVMLVSGNQFIDTKSVKPVHVDDAPLRSARILSFHEVKGK